MSEKSSFFGLEDIISDDDLMEYIIKYILTTESEIKDAILEAAGVRNSRTIIPRCDNFESTTWGLMLKNPLTADPCSYHGKKFRRRFRCTLNFFQEVLVPMCEDKGILRTRRTSRIPYPFKILCVLRMLGRADVADTTSELSHIGESTCRYLFATFVAQFSAAFYTKFIKFPEAEELLRVLEIYRKLGLPGAVGSMDGTHVSWGNCPQSLANECVGKEGYPTLGWMVIVNHNRRVLFCSNENYGSANDINMCNWTPELQDIIHGKWKDIEYSLLNNNGQPILCKGGYLITDAGMLKLPVFMDPTLTSFDPKCVYFREWLESVRKDVECFFSLLKNRFRFFRDSILLSDPVLIGRCSIWANTKLAWPYQNGYWNT
jgi:hypothetical protein